MSIQSSCVFLRMRSETSCVESRSPPSTSITTHGHLAHTRILDIRQSYSACCVSRARSSRELTGPANGPLLTLLGYSAGSGVPGIPDIRTETDPTPPSPPTAMLWPYSTGLSPQPVSQTEHHQFIDPSLNPPPLPSQPKFQVLSSDGTPSLSLAEYSQTRKTWSELMREPNIEEQVRKSRRGDAKVK